MEKEHNPAASPPRAMAVLPLSMTRPPRASAGGRQAKAAFWPAVQSMAA